MDINILLALQDFRNGAGAFLNSFLSKMTWLGELNTAIVIMALTYWCVSKDFGAYFLMGWSGNRLANGMLKVTVCAYRPWIRDARVIPYGDSITTATGYSFPSGHSMNGASLFGGLAIRRGIKPGFRVVLWIMVGLIAFSRIFLGVHTPQDILVGASVGILAMFLTGKLLEWIEKHPEKDILVAVIGVLIAVAAAVFSANKSYPVDYDAAGNLLVDGLKMANDTFKAVGWISAFMVGWILERRLIRFDVTEITMQQRFFRLIGGLLGYYVISLIINPIIKSSLEGFAPTVITCFLQMFYIVFLFPAIVKLVKKSHSKK